MADREWRIRRGKTGRVARVLAFCLGVVACGLATVPTAPDAQTLFRPVAIVNDSAITGYDITQRVRILTALGINAASPEALQQEALERLIADRLKLQAGKQIGITPSSDMIEAGIKDFAARAEATPDEFRAVMSAQGVSNMALDDMIGAEMVWGQVIVARFANRVQPGEAEIDAELEYIQQRSRYDYRIAEIGIPMRDEGRSEAETRALAEQLYDALNNGGDFSQAVKRYSRSPSAARGGEVGWVSAQRMPPDLLRALTELEIGEVTRPMAVPGGLSLLKLVDRRETGRDLSTDEDLRERVRRQLINRKSNRLAEGLLQELRRDALIEFR